MHTSRIYEDLDRGVGVQLHCNVGVERSRTALPGDSVDRMATQNLIPLLNQLRPAAIMLFGFTLVPCGQSRVQRRTFSRIDVGFDPKYRSFHVIGQQFNTT